MDNIEAPWIGDDDYGKHNSISQDDYEWYMQDDWRKDEQIRAAIEELETD